MLNIVYTLEDILEGRIKLEIHPDYDSATKEILKSMIKESDFPERVSVKDIEYNVVINNKADKNEWKKRIDRAIQSGTLNGSGDELDIIEFVCEQDDITSVTTKILSDPDDFRGLVAYEDDEVFANTLEDALENREILVEAFKEIRGDDYIVEIVKQNNELYSYNLGIEDIDIRYIGTNISMEQFVERYRKRIKSYTIEDFINEGEFWELLIENKHTKFDIDRRVAFR
ncbi:hypothetical protein G8Y85_02995 [Staphylococcus sp. 11007852]|uniref:hypothetical protein n=1 Tax=Staphylococcus sp. 11007852 TaxID=2714543 RepID=UPI001402AA5D|nr:hypothetical protein [Staphylococcus sp. 11007852]NHM74401.1 hypothetical protein [Staphylococcus sp. 11007852]